MRQRKRSLPTIYGILTLAFVILAGAYLYRSYQIDAVERHPFTVALNTAIEEAIRGGKPDLGLSDIGDLRWNCACIHEQYHTVANSIERCLRTEISSNKSHIIEDTSFRITPYNFSAKEDRNNIILLDFTSKTATVYRPTYRLDGVVWPCFERSRARLKIGTDRFSRKPNLELISGEE